MRGWVTWLVAGAAAVYAVGGYIAGLHDQDKMMDLLLYAGGLIGIGRKIDKSSIGNAGCPD